MDERAHYYHKLKKPTWSPPSWVFGPVWTILYILIAFSFSKIIYLSYIKSIPEFIGIIFVINFVANILFSPLQFVLRSNLLAFIDVVVVLVTLAIGMFFAYQYTPFEVWLLVPYVLWVTFATLLQGSVTYLNRRR